MFHNPLQRAQVPPKVAAGAAKGAAAGAVTTVKDVAASAGHGAAKGLREAEAGVEHAAAAAKGEFWGNSFGSHSHLA